MKIVKELVKAICYISLGAILSFGVLAKISDSPKAPVPSIVDDIMWIHAPDDSTGIELVDATHPFYKIKAYYSSGNVWFEGTVKYVCKSKGTIKLTDITGFDGETFYLRQGGYLQKVSEK